MTDAVSVWLLRAEERLSEEARGKLLASLSAAERARWAGIGHADVKDEYLRARAMVRGVLSAVAGGDASGWQFVENRHGKPSAVDAKGRPGPAFNLSHTKGFLVVAAHPDPATVVGVDVEYLDRRGATVTVADRFFSVREVEALRRLPEGAQRSRFFDHWTLKEAYLKAVGVGVSLGLGRFGFVMGEEEVRVEFDADLGDDPSRWRFVQFDPTPSHRVALALGSAPYTHRIEEWGLVVADGAR